LLKGEGYYVLEDYLRQHKEHSHYDSWVSRHQITIVIDKMECSRTTSNFEKSKKLYKSENGHYLINRCFVVGDSEELFIVDSVLYDNTCGKSSVSVAQNMLQELIILLIAII
jgi:hypothetical protein